MNDAAFARMSDGRRLAFADHGPRQAPPVLLCYGTPSSRLVGPVHARLADELGFRLIVPDRPGFGLSDPQPGRSLRDWPRDAASLLDALGLTGASVVGSSGGGPYAVACAALLGPRVLAVALHAPAPPCGSPQRGFVPTDPSELRKRGSTFATLLATGPDRLLAMVGASLSAPDQARLQEAEVRAAALAMFQEAFRQGVDAYVEDHLINQSAWEDLIPNVAQTVRLWQGDTDNNVPLGATDHLAGLFRRSALTVLPNTGHILREDQWRALYQQLLEDARQ